MPDAPRAPGLRAVVLAADLGNTRAKLTRFELAATGDATSAGAGGIGLEPVGDTLALEWNGHGLALAPAGAGGGERPRDPAASVASLAASIGAWLAHAAGPRSTVVLAAISSVAGPARSEALRAALRAAGVVEVVARPAPGIENATRTPETVGHDRLYAARGAYERLGRRLPALIVDAGTALTVDALAAAAGGRQGNVGVPHGASGGRPRFLGGAIAPGPSLLADALARRAAQLPAVEPRPCASAWGRDTPGAIEAGVVVGFRGAAARLVTELGRATGLADAPLVVTGGARAFLLEPEPFLPGRTLVVDPWLVERGLLAAALDGGRP